MSALSRMCSIFCCPPFPSKIASKLAFAPPEPSYHIVQDNSTSCLILKDVADWQYSEADKEYIDGFYTRTKRGNKIACIYIRCSDTARYTILFSHGNAVDMGHMSSFYFGIGHWLNCNVFSYDYSGYGESEGTPSEKNIYADIEAAWASLISKYKVKSENIILYGQSIGTVPTVDLAAKQQVGAVVLHSALMSGFRILCPSTRRTWFFDVFPNIDKVQKITAPTLVIHGKQDSIVDISHGLKIYEKCKKAVEPLWVEGAGHDDLDCRCGAYLERLRAFINLELTHS